MKTIEIEGEATIQFYQRLTVTDEEFEILSYDQSDEINKILESKIDFDNVSQVDNFYIYNIEEIENEYNK